MSRLRRKRSSSALRTKNKRPMLSPKGGSSSLRIGIFFRIHATGVAHAGIVFCRQGKRGIGGIIRGLTEIWEVMEPHEMSNWLVYL